MNSESVIIIDGMDILEMLKLVKPMDNVGHLLDAFKTELLSELNNVSQNYSEVRILFSRFVPNSLNESRYWPSSFKRATIRYHVSEKTPIKKLDLFLAHIDTRVELTEFLGNKLLQSFSVSEIKVVVGYGNKFYSND